MSRLRLGGHDCTLVVMSRLYHFLTTDPDYRPGENMGDFFKRVNKRRAIQRIIRSFPREFQLLDEKLFSDSMRKAGGDKLEIVSGGIGTFTGRERLASAMVAPIRENANPSPKPPTDPNILKALEWVKSRKYQPIEP